MANYRAHLSSRLGLFTRYSDDYMRVWRQIQQLDDQREQQDKATADAARRAAEEVEKAQADAAEAIKKAEREAMDAAERAANRSAMQAITAANIRGATYQSVNTGADPYSVIRAIQQYERNNGAGWRRA